MTYAPSLPKTYQKYTIGIGEVDLINGVVVAVTASVGHLMHKTVDELPADAVPVDDVKVVA